MLDEELLVHGMAVERSQQPVERCLVVPPLRRSFPREAFPA